VGLALVSVVGWVLYGQALDAYAIGGIVLVTLGVVVLSFSRTAA
jgi:small multidrug resistance pump